MQKPVRRNNQVGPTVSTPISSTFTLKRDPLPCHKDRASLSADASRGGGIHTRPRRGHISQSLDYVLWASSLVEQILKQRSSFEAFADKEKEELKSRLSCSAAGERTAGSNPRDTHALVSLSWWVFAAAVDAHKGFCSRHARQAQLSLHSSRSEPLH